MSWATCSFGVFSRKPGQATGRVTCADALCAVKTEHRVKGGGDLGFPFETKCLPPLQHENSVNLNDTCEFLQVVTQTIQRNRLVTNVRAPQHCMQTGRRRTVSAFGGNFLDGCRHPCLTPLPAGFTDGIEHASPPAAGGLWPSEGCTEPRPASCGSAVRSCLGGSLCHTGIFFILRKAHR